VDTPLYEYYCPTCQREVSIAQTIQEHSREPPAPAAAAATWRRGSGPSSRRPRGRA